MDCIYIYYSILKVSNGDGRMKETDFFSAPDNLDCLLAQNNL